MDERAGTVELTAEIDDKVLYFYMVPGCCALRACGSFNSATPEQVCKGIVESGISGNVMVMVDAYSGGADARAFRRYVHEHDLGVVTLSEGVNNQYTDAELITVTFEYRPNVLAEKLYGSEWERPEGWYSSTDRVWMDDVFYQNGGRPKLKEKVWWRDY
jgi:hypothetical protein